MPDRAVVECPKCKGEVVNVDCALCGGTGQVDRLVKPPPRAVVDDDRHFHWSNAVAEMTPQDQADWIASVAGDDDEAVIARMKAAPPRAVVDKMCPQRVGVAGSWHHWSAPDPDDSGRRTCLDCGATIQAIESSPRALVALSKDRQWLVVHRLEGFVVYEGVPSGLLFEAMKVYQDTGQDAHEVLREWMEGRE